MSYQNTTTPPGHPIQNAPFWLRGAFWICTFIAIAVVVRRIVTLANPTSSSNATQFTQLDSAFASHAVLTLGHIIPALLFVAIAPFAFLRTTRDAVWPERILFPLGVIVGITAYAMSLYAVGGWIERSAVLVFDTAFLLSLARAYSYRRSGDIVLKRLWLTRAVAILLGIATTRPVMGFFFATSRMTHLSLEQFFGIAFWIGFSINVVVIELWLRATRRQFSL
ncbi:MAG: hypothetical protein JWM43_3453 [Acidobacteriaceae bacterium]|nr:hypothetical protein [Acidobacteriaceae bacterium]